MLDHYEAAFTSSDPHAASSFRDRLPTLPHDLSELAWSETGPSSWSAHRDTDALSAWALEAHDDPTCAAMTEMLVDLSPLDVPRVAMTLEQVARIVSHREAFVVASIDGESTVEMMLDAVDRERSGEILEILCSLCARGIVAIDAAGRNSR